MPLREVKRPLYEPGPKENAPLAEPIRSYGREVKSSQFTAMGLPRTLISFLLPAPHPYAGSGELSAGWIRIRVPV